MRRALMRRLEHQDLREVLDALQREHWGKRVLLPWVVHRRLRRDERHGLVPRRKEARA